jgi:hypothetical protein
MQRKDLNGVLVSSPFGHRVTGVPCMFVFRASVQYTNHCRHGRLVVCGVARSVFVVPGVRPLAVDCSLRPLAQGIGTSCGTTAYHKDYLAEGVSEETRDCLFCGLENGPVLWSTRHG